MPTRKKRRGIEWVGGIAAMPAYVTGEGEPYRPETLFWMSAEGAVLGHTLGKPGELVKTACESLRSTIEQPMFGPPHAPNRVRVASRELAEALRLGNPEIEVVCAPTPLVCTMGLPEGVRTEVPPPAEKRVAISSKVLDEVQISQGGTCPLSFPVDRHRGVVDDNGTATVCAMMPSDLKLFAERRLPRPFLEGARTIYHQQP